MPRTDYDIAIAGSGPSGISFAYFLDQIMRDPAKFARQYENYIPSNILNSLEKSHLDVSIALIRGNRPNNQFVAVWDNPYDELKPFGLHVSDYALHYSKILEWVLPSGTISYSSPYCSIDHLKVLDTFENRMKSRITFFDDSLSTFSCSRDQVSCKLSNQAITCRLLADACGYQSEVNKHFGLNKNPIYQMIVWKYPNIQGLDRNVNTIWYKPAKLYSQFGFDVNDRVSGWFHPLKDGNIIGISKYLYEPMEWATLTREFQRYFNAYVQLLELKLEGTPEIFQGIGTLYDPYHKLKANRIIQLGDARRIARPCTGYGFIPGLWHGLFAAIATAVSLDQKNNVDKIDRLTMTLFKRLFYFNYCFLYSVQTNFIGADWKLVNLIFQMVQDFMAQVPEGLFDRLTMSRFTRQDLDIGYKMFYKKIFPFAKIFLKSPLFIIKEATLGLILNRILNHNKNMKILE